MGIIESFQYGQRVTRIGGVGQSRLCREDKAQQVLLLAARPAGETRRWPSLPVWPAVSARGGGKGGAVYPIRTQSVQKASLKNRILRQFALGGSIKPIESDCRELTCRDGPRT